MKKEQPTTQEFKDQVKQWMDGDTTTPLRITRKNGDAFVMVTQAEYEQMQQELVNLRGQTKGLLDVIHGRTEVATEESIDKIFASAQKK